jgi:formate dehydrogenase major subunit
MTKRIRPLICDGKTVHIIGIPLHWGFTGVAKQGFWTQCVDALCR